MTDRLPSRLRLFDIQADWEYWVVAAPDEATAERYALAEYREVRDDPEAQADLRIAELTIPPEGGVIYRWAR